MLDIKNRGYVTAVSKSANHSFSKTVSKECVLEAGLGVTGDAHNGKTVKHCSRVAIDPCQPNLQQVHLIHSELHDELVAAGFEVGPAIMGENITTRGVNLLALPRDAKLKIGSSAILQITELRNPCKQLEDYQKDQLSAVLDKTNDGDLIRKCGVMGIVLLGGVIKLEDDVFISPPKAAFS